MEKYTCVITPNVKTYSLKSTKWTVGYEVKRNLIISFDEFGYVTSALMSGGVGFLTEQEVWDLGYYVSVNYMK